MARELLRTKHFVLTVDEEHQVIRRTRTAERFASLDELHEAYADLLRALDAIDRVHYAQLIDAREAPPRNDPEFEAAVTRMHTSLYRDFRRSAVLVHTAVGKLQVKRMLDASGVDAPAFTDEEAALLYLQGRASARPGG
jgi:hypothetical protein